MFTFIQYAHLAAADDLSNIERDREKEGNREQTIMP